MAINAPSFARATEHATPRIVADRRLHKRVNLTLLGRFMRENKQEFPCKLQDISVGGAALISPSPVELNERIIAYFDQIGGIEGHVARVFEGGFAVQIKATQHKREKLAAQLTWLINRQDMGPVNARRHERAIPANSDSTLELDEGITIQVQILDVSMSGASIATEARPDLGHEVQLGRLRGRVVRHHDRGIGIQFLDIQNPTALRRYFG